MAVDGLLAARPSSLIAPRGVWWEVFSSLAETPPVVNMEVETCSHCPARLSLSYLGWTTCLPGRLFTDLGKGKAAGGNVCPGQRCSPTAIAVSRGLPLSTSVILMWSGRRSMHFGLQRVRRASWPIWSIMLQRGCIRRHFAKLDLSMRPHGEWHHDFQDLVRKGVRRRGCAAPCIICHHSAEMELLVASTLVTSSVTTKVSESREGRRESAHQRSLSRLRAFPSLSSPLASLSPVMGLDPQWWTSDGS